MFRLGVLLVLGLAILVGGWISYRATTEESEPFCRAVGANAIACLDPDDPVSSYRVVYIKEGKVVSIP